MTPCTMICLKEKNHPGSWIINRQNISMIMIAQSKESFILLLLLKLPMTFEEINKVTKGDQKVLICPVAKSTNENQINLRSKSVQLS